MRILFAVDGSSYTTKAADYLVDHLRHFNDSIELHLFHVELPIIGHAAKYLGKALVDNYYKEESEAAMASAEAILKKHNVPFQSSYTKGDAALEIQKYAKKNKIDMIVMGSHGHGALKNLVMGSVANKVLACTNIPVLIVR